jgi:apyrase
MAYLLQKLKILWFSIPFFIFSFSAAAAQYAIYMDAGSSGTRLYLYQYENAKLPSIKQIFSKKISPGLSSFQSNPIDASDSVKELLDSTQSILKKHNIHTQKIPVNILSTGGMRLLTPEEQNKIYTELKQLIKQSNDFSLGKIKTISGEEEGLYGWLTINYLSQTFQKKLPTLGSLDMGNASTQITFATNNEPQKHLIPVKLAGNDYHIVSKSFLSLGLLEARKTITTNRSSASCYPLHYPINAMQFGKFNFEHCSFLYSQLIKKNKVSQVIHYPKKMQFIAYSAFYGPLHFFNVDTQPSEKNIRYAIKSTCYKPWTVLEKTYSQTADANYLPHYCTEATYISDLLFKGYQLTSHQLRISKEINGQKIAWPLGALLYHLTNNELELQKI